VGSNALRWSSDVHQADWIAPRPRRRADRGTADPETVSDEET
jgi:hypothetical protein